MCAAVLQVENPTTTERTKVSWWTRNQNRWHHWLWLMSHTNWRGYEPLINSRESFLGSSKVKIYRFYRWWFQWLSFSYLGRSFNLTTAHLFLEDGWHVHRHLGEVNMNEIWYQLNRLLVFTKQSTTGIASIWPVSQVHGTKPARL